MSSSRVCERPRRLCTKSITVGTPARATSAASCSGPDGSRCDLPATSRDRLVGQPDQRLVEEDRLDLPEPLPRDLDPLLGREAVGGGLRGGEHAGERVGVEVPLVEQLLGRLDDRGDDAGSADDVARGADRAAACRERDRTDLERELRGAGQRVPPLVHRRRAGMGGLAVPGDARSLDAEGAEHDPEREPERLEHRSLLDVELEVGTRICELRSRLERMLELDAVRAQGVGECDAVTVDQLRERRLVAHRAGRGRGAEERPPEPSALLVGPVDEPDSHRRTLLGDPAEHLGAGDDVQRAVEPAAVRDGVEVTADQERQGLPHRP